MRQEGTKAERDRVYCDWSWRTRWSLSWSCVGQTQWLTAALPRHAWMISAWEGDGHA